MSSSHDYLWRAEIICRGQNAYHKKQQVMYEANFKKSEIRTGKNGGYTGSSRALNHLCR